MSKGIDRRRFIALAGGGALSFMVYYLSDTSIRPVAKRDLMRPPGAVEENAFGGACIRCQKCMYVCPTSALKPATIADGLSKVFTPILDGECRYCWKCIQACPSGALQQIDIKNYKVGNAAIIRKLCIKCMICWDKCPFKAITRGDAKDEYYPLVDMKTCTGCGLCWVVCPVRPNRAIAMSSEGEIRVKAVRII